MEPNHSLEHLLRTGHLYLSVFNTELWLTEVHKWYFALFYQCTLITETLCLHSPVLGFLFVVFNHAFVRRIQILLIY